MLYEEPHMEIILLGAKDLPRTDLIDASGGGTDYPYGTQPTFG